MGGGMDESMDNPGVIEKKEEVERKGEEEMVWKLDDVVDDLMKVEVYFEEGLEILEISDQGGDMSEFIQGFEKVLQFEWLEDFCEKLGIGFDTKLVLDALKKIKKDNITWFSEYGCCLIKISKGTFTYFTVIGLDDWKGKVLLRKDDASTFYPIHSTICKGFRVIPIGKIETRYVPKFDNDFKRLFKKVKEKTKEKRSAVNGGIGHHKTPGCICSIVEKVLKDATNLSGSDTESDSDDDSYVHTLQGGFSDVGKHTGVFERTTRIYLLKSVLEFFVEQRSESPKRIMKYFSFILDLWVCCFSLTLLDRQDKEQESFCRQALLHVGKRLSEISYSPLSANLVECLQRKLNTAVHPSDSLSNMETGEIQEILKSIGMAQHLESFLIKFPSMAHVQHITHDALRECGVVDFTEREKIIQQFFLYDPPVSEEKFENPVIKAEPIGEVKNIFQNRIDTRPDPEESDGDGIIRAYMLTIELEFFNLANKLKSQSSLEELGFEKLEDQATSYCEENEKIIEAYPSSYPFRLRNELQSKGTLIWWILTCLLHKRAEKKLPEMAKYATPLSEKRLGNLVLSTKIARDALHQVIDYLCCKNSRNGSIFGGLADRYRTKDFIVEISKKIVNPHAHELNTEKQNSSKKISCHWEEIKSRKEKLNELEREKIRKLNELEREKIRKRHEMKYWLDKTEENEMRSIKDKIKKAERDIPAEPHLSLTHTKEQACLSCFFLPIELQDYICCLFKAQYQLVGKKKLVETKEDALQFFQNHANTVLSRSTFDRYRISVFMEKRVIGSRVDHVRNFDSELDNVYHLDFGTVMFFPKGNTRDPFYLYDVNNRYQEQFENSSLNYIISLSVENNSLDSTRGNIPIANSKPCTKLGITKEQYRILANLRAYGMIQFESLCVLLRDEELLFENESVLKVLYLVIRQLMFHVGEIGENGEFKWWERIGKKQWKELGDILKAKGEKLKSSPKYYLTLLCLCEIGAFYHQFYSPLKSIVLKLGKYFLDWYDQIQDNWRRCYFAGSYVLAMNLMTELNQRDLKEMMLAVIKFNDSFSMIKFANEDLLLLKYDVEQIIGAKFYTIEKEVEPEFGAEICELVFDTKLGAEYDWTWDTKKYLGWIESTNCDVHYHINILDGTVLKDYLPKKQLPRNITNNDTFKKLFEGKAFKVYMDLHGGCFKSVPASGEQFSYSFAYSKKKSTQLIICEYLNNDSNENTYYLTYVDLDKPDGLPKKLTMDYFVWKDIRNDTLVFRNKETNIIEYIFFEKCLYVVPRSVREEEDSWDYRILINKLVDFDKLVIGTSSALERLEAFESKEHIHIHLTCQDEILYFLPRYGFRFFDRKDGKRPQSLDWSGYFLSNYYLLTPANAKQVLLLKNDKSFERKLLFPYGKVKQTGRIEIMEYESNIDYFEYSIDKRFDGFIKSNTNDGKLFLATLYATMKPLNPDPILGVPANEIILDILRGLNFTITANERTQKILCCLIEKCLMYPSVFLLLNSMSQRLLFENFDENNNFTQQFYSCYDQELKTLVEFPEFMGIEKNFYLQMRSEEVYYSRPPLLTPQEELEIFGYELPKLNYYPTPYLHDSSIVNFLKESVHKRCEYIEDQLSQQLAKQKETKPSSFPLKFSSMEEKIIDNSTIGKELIQDLKDSFDVFCSLPTYKPKLDINQIKQSLKELGEVREKLEHEIKQTLSQCHAKQVFLRVIQAVGFSRISHQMSWLQIGGAMEEGLKLVNVYSPLLDQTARVQLQQAIRVWMTSCVLEDKLERILQLQNFESKIVRELKCTREWSIDDYPSWLAFEVRNKIQIRPEQSRIAIQLIESQENITTQLNVGLGKTRVITPLILLHYISIQKSVRLHVPSEIFDETCASIADSLVGGGVQLFKLPFNRSIEENEAQYAKDCYIRWREAQNGILCTKSEWRLSFELKEKSFEFLHSIVNEKVCLNLFDECDLLLSPNFRLVYAEGLQVKLPDLRERVDAIQLILHTLTKPKRKSLSKFFKDLEDYIQISKPHATGGFRNIVIDEKIDAKKFDEFIDLISKDILKDPPYQLNWVKTSSTIDDKIIHKIFCEKSIDPLKQIEEHGLENHQSQLLALRGILAGGVLFSCLTKRHRINFGIAKGKFKRSKEACNLAVPFDSCDTPKMRSDFVHPDCLLLYSQVSHYNDGLSPEAFEETVRTLLGSKKNTKIDTEFNKWTKSSEGEKKPPIKTPRSIDLENSVLMEQLYEFFRYNMYTIDFYLREIVFVRECGQYESQIGKNAWDLLENAEKSCGFSGTNDTYRLLPLKIKQKLANDDTIKATNGEMISRIITATKDVLHLDPIKEVKLNLIEVAKKNKAGCIIDAGGLLLGVDLEKMARQMLNEDYFNQNFRGICFYSNNEWYVLDKESKLLFTLRKSPVKEFESFAIYDQARTRGSDLKLQNDVLAILTLGLNLQKADFVQAAGRLRDLAHNQSLLIVCQKSEYKHFARSSVRKPSMRSIKSLLGKGDVKASICNVIGWTIMNSIRSFEKSMQHWLQQGVYFVKSDYGKNPVLEDVKLQLEDLYGPYVSQFPPDMKEEKKYSKIFKYFDYYQKNKTDTTIVECDKECEREVEQTAEQEEEKEMEIKKEEPRPETDIDADHIESHPLSILIKEHLEDLFGHIQWKNVHATENFFYTIADTFFDDCDDAKYDYFLRCIKFLLIKKDGTVVLVSEREANALMEIQTSKKPSKEFELVLWSYLLNPSPEQPFSYKNPNHKKNIKDEVILELQLFACDVNIKKGSKNLIQGLINPETHIQHAKFENMLNCRSNGLDYDESELFNIINLLL